ncbi:Undefined function [Listeria monocytogenes N53-1]|nr:Undefined function [Listeria monocytogenes]CCQ23326.1 Undefined function [Listeria monocytogenes N53-1]
MDAKTIIENRFQSQKLIQTARSGSPERIVFHFGAMQAQNYGQSLWAVGSRMTTPSE